MAHLINKIVSRAVRLANKAANKLGGDITYRERHDGNWYVDPRFSVGWNGCEEDEKPLQDPRFRLRQHYTDDLGRLRSRTLRIDLSRSPGTMFNLRASAENHDGDELTVGLGLLSASLYVTLDGVGKEFIDKFIGDGHEEKVLFGFSAHKERKTLNLHWQLMDYPMGYGDQRSSGVIFLPEAIVDRVFGKQRIVNTSAMKSNVKVPMPEGDYDAVVTREAVVYIRDRSPLYEKQVSARIDCDIGIPFEGKGENSWDCGEDACYGTGTNDASLSDEAVALILRDAVLRNRKKYGPGIEYPPPAERRARLELQRSKRADDDAADGPALSLVPSN